MPPNTYLRTLSCISEVPVRKFYCIGLYLPDYIADIPIYSKQLNSHTSSHIQLLTGCLLFPVLPDMLIKCIKAPVYYLIPTTSTNFILFKQHIRKDRVFQLMDSICIILFPVMLKNSCFRVLFFYNLIFPLSQPSRKPIPPEPNLILTPSSRICSLNV